MSTYLEASDALDHYRAALLEGQLNEDITAVSFSTRGTAAFTRKAPLHNVHATGVGLRIKNGKIFGKSFVIKVYVFDKRDLGSAAPKLTSKSFGGVQIDIEHLPVQQPMAKKNAAAGAAPQVTTPAQHQARHRPLQGGIQTRPTTVNYVGTLGGIVRRGNDFFILSNNHVLANVNRLPLGRRIVQPSGASHVARLSDFEPIRFPSSAGTPRNRMDAAIALLDDAQLTTMPCQMFGIANYTPTIATPQPHMAVTKSGRTTAVTQGVVTATRVNGVQVNFNPPGTNPPNPALIATFDNCVSVVGNGGHFSRPGDSGSFILNAQTGRPVALLFAGDDNRTWGCDMSTVCTRFNVVPA